MSDLDRLQLVQASARVEMERASRELRDLKEEAAQLRRENKALRSTLRIQNTTRGNGVVPLAASGSAPSVSDPSTDIQRKEVSTLQQQVFALRSKLDETRSSALKKQKVYEEISEKNRELEGEREPILNPNNPLNMKVHMLENRLDKSMVKFNEAMNIRRTYEAIVRKLQEERVTYDKQLASIEKTLHTKETDLKELSNMCRNATNARDIAKAELAQFKLNLEEERKKRQKDLEERRAMVQARKERLKTTKKMNEPKPVVESVRKESDEEIRARQVEEERKEEERICLAQYVSDFQMIREVTGAETAEEVIMKFIAQQDTSVTLTDMSKDAQAKLETLTAERAELRARLEDALFRGSGHMSSRRVLDEFRVHLSEAKMEAARTREEYEDLSNILVNCKAGVLHVRNTLAFDSKSSDISTTGGDTANAQNTTEDTAEILRAVGEKLQTLIEETAQLPLVEAVTSTAADHNSIPTHTMAPNVPKNNLRIRLTDRDDEGGDTMDEEEEGDEDVYDRERVKKFAQIAVLRETKRRNKKKKTPEE